jgi:hypothetical protein
MMPTFIVAGPPRCATTSTYYYLRQHPQVFMSPIKETNFFAYLASQRGLSLAQSTMNRPVRSLEAYQQQFEGAGGALAVGEASPIYFWIAGAAELIRAYLPEIRLVFILRNPIDRAYSAFLKSVQDGEEQRSFEEAVNQELLHPDEEPDRARGFYVRIGFYSRFLARFTSVFGPDQLCISFQDDLESAPATFLRNLLLFIGVDPERHVDTSARYNTSQVVRADTLLRAGRWKAVSQRLGRFIPAPIYRQLYRGYSASLDRLIEVPPVRAETRRRLCGAYASDIRELQALSGRDLSHWLTA